MVLVTGAAAAAGASVCVIVIGGSYSKAGRDGRHATRATHESTTTTVHRMSPGHSALTRRLQPCQARRTVL